MEVSKMFDNYMDITYTDNSSKKYKKIHIEKQNIFIHDFPSFYGTANIIEENGNIYIIKEVYSLENNRLRYSYDKFENVKSYNTQERTPDGTEIPIKIIEAFTDKVTCIGSIGNIKSIDSDKINIKDNDGLDKETSLILRLLRKKNNKSNAESSNSLNKEAA